jgi:hypothetical protein
MRWHQGLETHLNRKRGLAGRRERISMRVSSEGQATRNLAPLGVGVGVGAIHVAAKGGAQR